MTFAYDPPDGGRAEGGLPSRFLPLSVKIEGRRVLLVGGGRAAAQKLRLLRSFAGEVSVVAKEASAEIIASGVKVTVKEYEPADLDGFFLVYACTNDRALNRRIRDDAHARRLLVNVVDDVGLSDFISPAVFKEEHMTVAVASDGRDVRRSIAWRDRIRELFEHGDPDGDYPS